MKVKGDVADSEELEEDEMNDDDEVDDDVSGQTDYNDTLTSNTDGQDTPAISLKGILQVETHVTCRPQNQSRVPPQAKPWESPKGLGGSKIIDFGQFGILLDLVVVVRDDVQRLDCEV